MIKTFGVDDDVRLLWKRRKRQRMKRSLIAVSSRRNYQPIRGHHCTFQHSSFLGHYFLSLSLSLFIVYLHCHFHFRQKPQSRKRLAPSSLNGMNFPKKLSEFGGYPHITTYYISKLGGFQPPPPLKDCHGLDLCYVLALHSKKLLGFRKP